MSCARTSRELGRRAWALSRALDAVAIGFFLVLLAMSWGAIYALYSAGGAAG